MEWITFFFDTCARCFVRAKSVGRLPFSTSVPKSSWTGSHSFSGNVLANLYATQSKDIFLPEKIIAHVYGVLRNS